MADQSSRTRAVQTGVGTDEQFRAVMPPVFLSTNYRFHAPGEPGQYDYTRSGNPTRDLLAGALKDLEGGTSAVVTSSGMSAVTVALHLVPGGRKILVPSDCYGGTFRVIEALAGRGLLTPEYVDMWDPHALRAALSPEVGMIWVETPSNPLLRVTDIRSVCRGARQTGALVVVDNTFLSPVWQQPLQYGADIVVHSTTKYLNGHSDVVGGALVARDAQVGEDLAWWANCLGVTGSPFDSYQTMRGLRTLHARMDVHLRNTKRVVKTLQGSDVVEQVYYPGLDTHPQHALAVRQQGAPGAMVSFALRDEALVGPFVAALKVFSLAESLGGVESLVCHPATMTHASMTAEARRAAGITNRLIRLSVGIESPEDLVGDLDRALNACRGKGAALMP